MKHTSLFTHIIPKTLDSHPFLYNLLVISLSIGIGIVSFAALTLMALLGSFVVSETLSAGMAGMSILLIFESLAALGAVGIFLFLVIHNIRK